MRLQPTASRGGLAGGKLAGVRVYLMRAGTVAATGAPVPVFLIVTDQGQRILVDTGYPRERAGAYLSNRSEPIRLDPEDTVDRGLAAIGLSPAAIDYVVCSHLDPDHAGNHDLFPQAQFVVQRRHYRYALDPSQRRTALAAHRWNRPELCYREVDGDVTLVAGVELIESSGHVEGHQSVLVRLRVGRPLLLAIDAIPTTEAMDGDRRPIYPFDSDEAAVRSSTRRLVERARTENAAIICGHDADQWRTLRIAPDYYD